MERVECVTDQVRWSHSGGGDGVEGVDEDEYLEGDWRLMVVGMLIVNTVIVVICLMSRGSLFWSHGEV